MGHMLGSNCSACCGKRDCPECEELKTYSDRIKVSLSSDFGSGATVKADGPRDTFGNLGPITVTNGGSGYAMATRGPPAITATASNGFGATLSVSLYQFTASGKPVWGVQSVSVSTKDGGYGFYDGDSVSFSIAGDPNATEDSPASAFVRTKRAEPSLEASAGAGEGAAFSVFYSQNYGTPTTWAVSSVAVDSPGSGYTDEDYLYFSLGTGDQEDSQASATISTDENGAITGATVSYGGAYYKQTDKIDGVEVTSAGQYWSQDLTKTTVAKIEFKVSQLLPSNGSGATLTAVVEDSLASPDFGKLIAVSVTGGDSKYFAGGEICERVPRCGCCYLYGEPDNTIKNKTACDEAGGTWVAGSNCDELGCCCVDGVPNPEIETSLACSEAGGKWSPGVECSETGSCFDQGCCCVDGVINPGIASFAECAKAGGIWHADCDGPAVCDKPGCGAFVGLFGGWFLNGGAQWIGFLKGAGYAYAQLVTEAYQPNQADPAQFNPYTDQCGQTFGRIDAICCGAAQGCNPPTASFNPTQATGWQLPNQGGQFGPGGNLYAPCGANIQNPNAATVASCCPVAPPP